MIKGRSPFPMDTIAVAVSFSPGMESLLNEAKRLAIAHDCITVFIHVGKKTSEKQRRLGQLLTLNGFHDGNSRVYWESAGNVAAFLQVCKNEVVDLILAGCSDKDNFELPTGRFAKDLALRAKCSVLLYCGQRPSGAFRNIFVHISEHKKTEWTIATAIYFAEKEKAEKLVLLDEGTDKSEGHIVTKARSKWSSSLHTALDNSAISIHQQTAHGLSVSEYVFQNQADLMIINSNDHHLRIFDRIFSNSLEKALINPPCHLMIVHSRLQD